jgi:hypothetical protein
MKSFGIVYTLAVNVHLPGEFEFCLCKSFVGFAILGRFIRKILRLIEILTIGFVGNIVEINSKAVVYTCQQR